MKFNFTAVLALLGTTLFAGEEYDFEQLKQKYKDDQAIFLSEKEHVFITTKGNEFEIYNDVSWEMLYLSDRGKAYNDQTIQFSDFSEIQDIKAYTYLPKNGDPTKLKKEKVTKFKTEDVYNGSYFFHDNKQIAFDFTGTEAGTKTSLSYREVIKNPKFMGSAFLTSYLPTLKSEYSVSYPSNVEVLFKVFNAEGLDYKHTKTEKGGITTLTWKTENQDAYKRHSNAPNLRYYTPHVVAYIGKIELQDTTIQALPNLDGLYNWYYSLVKEVNADEDSTLKAITQEITAGVTSKDEKARIIFNWVQDNIKYVAFEDGMGGFIPRPAASVCRKRYGDCKDMASIITDMMRYAGEEANITWVGSDELPYDYTEIATPVVDNHMIASYRNEKNEVVILDAVGTYTPYGYPTGFIQGKQALIAKGEGKYEVFRIPVVSKEMNQENDFISMRLNKGKLEGTGKIEAHGYQKYGYVYKLGNMSNNEEQRNYIESYLEKGSNKFRVDEASFSGLQNRDTSLTIEYKFNLDSYINSSDDETYVNLNLDRDFKNSKLDIEERGGVARKFDHKMDMNYTVEFEIPSGSSVSYVPENAEAKHKGFGFSIKYLNKGNKITLQKNIYVDTLFIEEGQFEDWNKMIKQLKKAYKEVVIIKEK